MQNKPDPKDPSSLRPRGPWNQDLAFAKESPYAFRSGEIIVMNRAAADEARGRLADRFNIDPEPLVELGGDGFLLRVGPDLDIEEAVSSLRQLGLRAEPNYAFFAHSQTTSGCGGCGCALCGCGVGANPFAANPFAANPFAANPFAANPFAANSVTANPFAANPFAANPFAANPFAANPFAANGFASSGIRRTSAEPADIPKPDPVPARLPQHTAGHAVIYDTGISIKEHLPAALEGRPLLRGANVIDRDEPDESGDKILDPVAGHGTFIAGIIDHFAPKQRVRVSAVLSTFGHGFASNIANRIRADVAQMTDEIASRTILNMSFGSYADQEMYLLADAVSFAQSKGCVVVASAGNDGTYLPTFPATLPGVISVASIDECGRAPYSNYGPWVVACAPGSEILSPFYHSINADQQPTPGAEKMHINGFNGWATWSGTSFAAPVVVAAILRQMALHSQPAAEAAEVVINAPGLLKLPGLGTVVNLAAGM